MRVDSSQKENNSSSFRALVRMLPLSPLDLFYLLYSLPLFVPSLVAPHPSSFPIDGASLPSFTVSMQTREEDPRPSLLVNKSRPAGRLSFRMRDKLLNFFPFSFLTADSISVILVLFYVASAQLEHRVVNTCSTPTKICK